MRTSINQSKTGKSLLITFSEGYSTYTITIPMPYAVKFFAEGLEAALLTLLQEKEIQVKLNEADSQKTEIQERIGKSIRLFQEYAESNGR